jgi:vacuolar-type H+-ATPase subunit I/STV1
MPGDERRHRRRLGGVVDRLMGGSRAHASSTDQGMAAQLEVLRRRVDHLEAALEGLQDSVHRENVRREEELEDLRRHTSPAEMGRALDEDTRRRGL